MLRKLQDGLRGVSHVIVDEIHERDCNTDFLMVLLRDVVNAYPDLRVILMSATVDVALFTKYFGNAPVVEIPGKIHPVNVFYLEEIVETLQYFPSKKYQKKVTTTKKCKKGRKRKHGGEEVKDDEGDKENAADDVDCNQNVGPDFLEETRKSISLLSEDDNMNLELVESLLNYVDTMEVGKDGGAVLCFLPGWSAITLALKYFQKKPAFAARFFFLALHSRVPKQDQRNVFDRAPPGKRKVTCFLVTSLGLYLET